VQAFIASADRKLRLALLLLLESEPGMVVTGFTDRIDGLHAAVTSSQPDVLLLDSQLAITETVEIVQSLRMLRFPPRIIVLVLDSQANDKLLAAGAHAVIGTNMPPDTLLPLLRGIRNDYRSKPSGSTPAAS
jgi:DNA-binding NarL/FixJ family response regulator